MSDTANPVTKLSQTNIHQFFSPVSAEEARTANANHGVADTSQSHSHNANISYLMTAHQNLKLGDLEVISRSFG